MYAPLNAAPRLAGRIARGQKQCKVALGKISERNLALCAFAVLLALFLPLANRRPRLRNRLKKVVVVRTHAIARERPLGLRDRSATARRAGG